MCTGSYNVANSVSIQHELQERLRRCRGKQGLIFTSAGRLSPGVKGTFYTHLFQFICTLLCVADDTLSQGFRLSALLPSC